MTKSFIFKHDLRAAIESSNSKEFISFNDSDHQVQNRNPIGILKQFSDLYLQPNAQLNFEIEYSAIIIVLEGELNISFEKNNLEIYPGISTVIPYKKHCLISNTDIVARLLIISLETVLDYSTKHFEISSNKFTEILIGSQFSIRFGLFTGREHFTIPNDFNYSFLFCINGVLEVSEILLEANDALLETELSSLEGESLAPNTLFLSLFF